MDGIKNNEMIFSFVGYTHVIFDSAILIMSLFESGNFCARVQISSAVTGTIEATLIQYLSYLRVIFH